MIFIQMGYYNQKNPKLMYEKCERALSEAGKRIKLHVLLDFLVVFRQYIEHFVNQELYTPLYVYIN